ncbi:MAG TPA: hypothetical protein VEZ16_04555 [Microvirga sp.]|nr:hypothetical protein [Microvirga sp.]
MEDWQGRKREPITEERLERALDVLAEIVREHGPSHAHLLESMEQELAAFRRLRQTIDENSKPRQRKITRAA